MACYALELFESRIQSSKNCPINWWDADAMYDVEILKFISPHRKKREKGSQLTVTFVLVHGAFHGGWCWKKTAEILRSRGRIVCAPSLTGLADRSHLLSPEVGLETHVQDIVSLLEYEDLSDVVLVGHSYAGMVITSVAERAPARLARVVYLDAVIPEKNGERMYDLFPENFRKEDEDWMKQHNETWKLPPDPEATFGIEDEKDLLWLRQKLTPHPFKTFTDPIKLDGAKSKKVPRTYILCEKPATFREFALRAQALGWEVRSMKTGHDAMITRPLELCELLV